jgi:outer membrane protein TolC
MKASQAGVAAARAEFLPKVYLGAMAATGSSDLSAGNLPGIGQQASSAGILIGATVPIFDGGLRRNQLKNAQSVADAAQATFQQTQETAAREIFMAATTLQSALASYQAASELVRAAQVSYDATLESYRAGVGTVDVAAAASTALLEARRAQSDAHAASLVAAANLAFALGSMTSADVPLGLMGR